MVVVTSHNSELNSSQSAVASHLFITSSLISIQPSPILSFIYAVHKFTFMFMNDKTGQDASGEWRRESEM